MHPQLVLMLAEETERERRRLAERRVVAPPPAEPVREPVTLRLDTVHDVEALRRLAQLASRAAPTGAHVVADVRGEIVAALPLDGGAVFADPFRRTAHIRPLLELRARQLSGGRARLRRLSLRWSRA